MKAVTVRQMTRLAFTMAFSRGFSSSKQAADTGSGGAAGAFPSSFFLSIPHSQQRADESLDWDLTVDTEDEESGKEGGRSSAAERTGRENREKRLEERESPLRLWFAFPFTSSCSSPAITSTFFVSLCISSEASKPCSTEKTCCLDTAGSSYNVNQVRRLI